MNNIRQNQILRKKIKEKKKKQEKRLFVVFGMAATITLSVALISLSQSNNVNADTAQPLQSNETFILEKNEFENDQQNLTNLVDDSNQNENENFYDVVLGYKRVIKNAEVLESISSDSKILYNVTPSQYLEFMGEVDGWSKVSYKNIIGYVESSSLENTKENELKVIDGVLLATKEYLIPKDFKSRFNPEAENAMMIMFEAMKRDGLEVGVSRKYIESDAIIVENTNSENAFPTIEQHELRTGKSIEFSVQNAATAVDFEQTQQGKWLKSNAHKFGFVLRYPKGKEDITGFISNDKIYSYVGSEIATNMVENNLTLEEYFK